LVGGEEEEEEEEEEEDTTPIYSYMKLRYINKHSTEHLYKRSWGSSVIAVAGLMAGHQSNQLSIPGGGRDFLLSAVSRLPLIYKAYCGNFPVGKAFKV
jgi:hypothetical protein